MFYSSNRHLVDPLSVVSEYIFYSVPNFLPKFTPPRGGWVKSMPLPRVAPRPWKFAGATPGDRPPAPPLPRCLPFPRYPSARCRARSAPVAVIEIKVKHRRHRHCYFVGLLHCFFFFCWPPHLTLSAHCCRSFPLIAIGLFGQNDTGRLVNHHRTASVRQID